MKHMVSPLPKEQRLINQPYVPQNLVSGANTQIIWFTGDVGHTREITLIDENSKEVYNSRLKFNTATEPLLLNHSGKFTYFKKMQTWMIQNLLWKEVLQ